MQDPRKCLRRTLETESCDGRQKVDVIESYKSMQGLRKWLWRTLSSSSRTRDHRIKFLSSRFRRAKGRWDFTQRTCEMHSLPKEVVMATSTDGQTSK